MSKILIIAEHDGETLNQATAKVVSCAAAIGGDIDIAVFGHGIDGVAAEAAAIAGIGRVLAVDAEHLAAPLAANWAPEAVTAADGYSHVLGPSTTFGKDLMPRIAALLGVNQVSDIMAVDGAYAFKRPIYAGNAIIEVTAPADEVMVGTVRVASWRSAGDGGRGEGDGGSGLEDDVAVRVETDIGGQAAADEQLLEIAQQVREATRDWRDLPITIAVMGCRVNGPGETDDADLGLWCGPNYVNLKKGTEALGAFSYEEILPKLKSELDKMRIVWSTGYEDYDIHEVDFFMDQIRCLNDYQ